MSKIEFEPNRLSCSHVTLEMPYPKTKAGIENFLWYLYHDGARVVVGAKGGWFLLLPSRCSFLLESGDCGVSERGSVRGEGAFKACANILQGPPRAVFASEPDLIGWLRERRPALFAKLHAVTQGAAQAAINISAPKAGAWSGCGSCVAACCSYLNIILDRPTSARLTEDLLWFACREDTEVHLDYAGEWSLFYPGRCAHLGAGNLCDIYSRRPSICRKFSESECHAGELDNSFERNFRGGAELMNHLRKKRPALFRKVRPIIRKLVARKVACGS